MGRWQTWVERPVLAASACRRYRRQWAILCRSWLRSVLVKSEAIDGQVECERVIM
jgi:hypothetical protein